MATQKEMDVLFQLIQAASKVNSSSHRVGVSVEMNEARVTVRVVDPVVIMAAQPDGEWDWLFYDEKSAYFSNDVFTEEKFVERCQEFIAVVNGFEGYAAQEVAQ